MLTTADLPLPILESRAEARQSALSLERSSQPEAKRLDLQSTFVLGSRHSALLGHLRTPASTEVRDRNDH